ncbi:MAG TPA: DHA2 family efflux MFS transporter permease subunit [Xanthobacteraceae bacterium]|nr:DHA2 family efflux MFS transporter permease subunit [Xanthobacteraceae bacterium]
MTNTRLISLIVAVALFMENMDSTVIATALPAIAADIGSNPLALKLAITSYLLSLAIFIPASGWVADRFGTRTVFRAAITVFVLGSIACAMSNSLVDFVAARMLQGVGGAMMTPVGRLILLRSIDRRALLNAMAWVTMPALIGPMVGPPIGGFITTYASWHWIFIINVPIGILGIVLVTLYVDEIRAEKQERFDFVGMALAGLGLGGVAFGLSVAGLDLLPLTPVLVLTAAGAVFLVLYVRHAKRHPAPVLDLSLLSIPTFRATVTGGFLFRLGIGAWPFLMPLMLQLGLKMNPFQSGLITFAGSFGALLMKPVIAPLLKNFGFKNILVPNAVISGALLAACAIFTETTPITAMFLILVVGGFFRSLEFTSINTLAYADVPSQRMSTATSLVSVLQQVSISCGVAVGALLVEITNRFNDSGTLTTDDFRPAFLIVGAISASAVFIFMGLHKDAGAEMANRKSSSSVTPDDRVT